MYDEIYLRGYGDDDDSDDNSQQQEEQLMEGWTFCAEPKTEPKTIILFGDEDH